jgi:uncharacterized protein (DUF1800 family)
MTQPKRPSLCLCHPSKLLIAALAALLLAAVSGSHWTSFTASASERESARSKTFPGKLPITELTEDQAILHALNRLGFGPRPGDVERVRQMGLENWIEQQLHPESIDDSAVNQQLDRFPTLKLSSAQLLKDYPQPPPVAQQAAQQARATPQQIARARQQAQQQRQAQRSPRGNSDTMNGAPQRGASTPGMSEGMSGGMADGMSGDRDSMSSQTPSAPQPPSPLPASAPGRPPGPGPVRIADLPKPQQIVQELSIGKLTRAVYSERQLDEVMADFWFNHFNVFAGKGADRWLLTSYERDTIRPHTLGKFEDLLLATAKSPAMQFYLDNWQSADPESFDRLQDELQGRRRQMAQRYWMLGLEPPPQNQPNRPRRGLNENYARELMELHTLGVQGGYTQKDVTEMARVFTGWTIRQPRQNPEFYFEARLHDPGTKTILGKKFHGGGMREGEQVLAMLAHHPSTAHFISEKLAERFVSDQPPQALVERMAQAFLKSDGDIRTVLHTMIYSPEFWSQEAYRAKIKTPFELVASTVRALGFQGDLPLALVQWTARIGEPLYQCQPPNGYSDKADAWVNTGALLNRMNFALQAANGGGPNARPPLETLLGPDAGGTPDQMLSRFIDVFLGSDVSPATRTTIESKLAQAPQAPALRARARQNVPAEIAGLVLGSPEFQRR